MTRQELVHAINERMGHNYFADPKLHKKGLVEAPYSMSDKGSRIVAIIEEFGWRVTESEMRQFCEEMMPDQVDEFMYLIKAAQDNTLE
jgi:hypothetical protein